MQIIYDMIAAKKREQEIIEKALEIKPPVDIRYNDVTGEYQWSVEIQGTEYWIDSFTTKQDAIDFCNEKKLPVMNILE